MRISSSDGSAVWPALGGIETFGFPAVAVFLRAASALFRIVDVRGAGVFLIFIWEVDPPASGGPPLISAWTILFFFGTD